MRCHYSEDFIQYITLYIMLVLKERAGKRVKSKYQVKSPIKETSIREQLLEVKFKILGILKIII